MCTPSKVPIVITAFLKAGRLSISEWTFIGCKINVQYAMCNTHCSVIFAAIPKFPDVVIFQKRSFSTKRRST
jgi:hypothetical protein